MHGLMFVFKLAETVVLLNCAR